MLEWPWASIVVAATCWSVGYPQQIEVPQYAQERQFYTQSRSAPLGTFKIPVSHSFFTLKATYHLDEKKSLCK